MLPILISWLVIAVARTNIQKFSSVLQHGDALMASSALAGTAFVLVVRRRQPETMIAAEVVGAVGVILVLICAVIFTEANSAELFSATFEQHLAISQRIVSLSIWLLAISFTYALYVTYQDERSLPLAEFREIYSQGEVSLKSDVDFNGGRADD
jgi:hypothetical protein